MTLWYNSSCHTVIGHPSADLLIITPFISGERLYGYGGIICGGRFNMGRIIVCQRCGNTKGHCSRNLCQKCYDYERFNGDLSKYPVVGRNRPSKRITAPCPRCGNIEPLTLSNGLCEKCYHKSAKNNNVIVCANCGQSKSHDSHGLCGSCASSKRIRENNLVLLKTDISN